MTDHHGPWGGPQAPPPKRGPSLKVRVGFLIWLGLIALAALTFWLLATFFPGQLHGADWGDALRIFGLLALVSSGLVAVRRVDLGRTARQIGAWTAIVLVLLLGYSYRDDVVGVALRLRGALIPAYAAQTGPKSMMIERSEGGGFYVRGQVDQAQVRFAIDTGASDIVLSPADARRVGVDPATLKFSSASETANGVGYSAPIVVKSLTVGPIRLTDVPVLVNQAPMSASLLGASFLRRLSLFEIRGDHLFLEGPG